VSQYKYRENEKSIEATGSAHLQSRSKGGHGAAAWTSSDEDAAQARPPRYS
jgi:hypothetical protein